MFSRHGLRPTLRMLGWLLAVTLTGGVSCKGTDADEQQGPSCEEIGAHLARLCNYTTARQAEVQCELLGASRSSRECVLSQNQCTTCGLTNTSFTCDQDSDCPGELRCNPEREECTECVTDSDCAAPLYCPDGYCIPMPECEYLDDCTPPAVCNAHECRVLSPCESDADCVFPDECEANFDGSGTVCMVVN